MVLDDRVLFCQSVAAYVTMASGEVHVAPFDPSLCGLITCLPQAFFIQRSCHVPFATAPLLHTEFYQAMLFFKWSTKCERTLLMPRCVASDAQFLGYSSLPGLWLALQKLQHSLKIPFANAYSKGLWANSDSTADLPAFKLSNARLLC